MNKKEAALMLAQIAQKEGKSVEQLRGELQEHINVLVHSENAQTRHQWAQVLCAGETPTPEEVLMHLGRQFQDWPELLAFMLL